MASGLDLLEEKSTVGLNNAPQKIIKEAKSGIELLNDSSVSTPAAPKIEEPRINVDAYDPVKLFGKIAPKAPEKRSTDEPLSFRQGEEDSFVTKMIDSVSNLFTSKAKESAKAAYQIASAEYFKTNPSNISPDLIDAFKSGYGMTVPGLISQIERGTKYPKPIPEGMDTKQKIAAGAGGIVGSLPTFLAFSKAGAPAGPIGMMMAGFAGDHGLRAYYLHKLEKGEVNSPREFVDALKKVVPETLKGAALGVATGVAGKAAAPLGIEAKVGAEAGVMTIMGAALEGNLPTGEDFLINAALFGSLHGIGKTSTVAKNIKDVWVKTGRKPNDIVEDSKVDQSLKEALSNEEGIPEDVIAKAQAKVDAIEKIQAELAAKLEALKEPVEPETLVKEELKIKGKKVEEIKEGKDIEIEPFDSDKEMLKSLGYEEAEIAKMKPEDIAKKLSEDEIVQPLNELKQTSAEPVKSGIELLNKAIDELPVEAKVKEKRVKREKKAKVVDEPLTVYHRTFDESIKEVNFDAFYGTKEFSDSFKESFGPYEHKLIIPAEIEKKIINLDADNIIARKFKAEVVKEAYPNDPNIKNIVKDIIEGKDSEDFYNEYVDKNLILPILKKNNLLGSHFQGEYILSKEAIKASREIEAKRPITDLDLQTGTPLPEKLKTNNHPFRDKDPKHTETMHKLLQEKVNNVEASPEVFTRYLINEVNRYLNGEEVAIDKVRNGLSELATRADNLKTQFERPEDFNAWRGNVREAARWARESDRLIDKRTGGTKLTMGVDPTEATKKIVAGAKALAAYTAKARGMKEFKPSQALTMIKEEFIRSGVDRSGNIRRKLLDQLGNEGYEIIQKMYLSKGASSLAAQNLKQMRKEVYDGLSKNEKRILDNLILADRMLDIGKYKTESQFKFPEGLTPKESAAYNELFQFTEGITPERAEVLKQRAKGYFEWMKKPLKDMLDAELITQAEYDALASHNYRRLKLVDVFDKRYTSKIGKTKRTVYDSGVEALSHGRQTDVFEPSSEVMALEVFNRAYGRILNNAANKTLLDLARNQKDNPFVAVKEKPTDHIPTGWDRIFVYEKGERKAIYISPTMAKEWITNSPELSYKMSQILRYASGSPVLRTMATGIDWAFALANLPRDVMHIWYASRVFEDGKWTPLYNTNLPVYAGQIGADIGRVFSDAVFRKGRYLDYIKEGGGMEFLVHQGRLMQRGRHIEGGLDKVQDFLGYFGETSEILTRLAVRDRVIKRRAAEQGISYEEAAKDKKITQEATFAARDYMDFGQGGGVAKALDNAIPYLNASIQGTRGMFRAFKDNPVESSYKLAQFATLVTGLYIANQAINPKTMENLKGSIDMQGNLCIPLGDRFGFEDEKGQTRYPYIKIPLDPGQKFFKMFFEASYDKATGQQVDAEGVANSLSQVSPVAISSLPPTLSGALGYTYNKDFWLNDDIWKKTDKPLGWPSSKEEYIPGKTPKAFIDLGAVTGLSPERTKYAMSELVTGGSMWSWLAGQGYDAAFGDLPKEKKEMHLAEALSKIPIARRFIGITNPYSQYAEPINEAKEQSAMKRWIENRGLDQRVEAYLYEGGKRSDVIDYIVNTAKDQDTKDRLKDRFVFQEKIKGLPNRSFWLSLKGITDTEARAKIFVERFDKASPADQAQINKEIGIIINAGGIISDEFKQQVMKIRDANARAKASQ